MKIISIVRCNITLKNKSVAVCCYKIQSPLQKMQQEDKLKPVSPAEDKTSAKRQEGAKQ
jgi:hypothetical protein